MVECDLAKVEVAGSNPVSRSRFFQTPAEMRFYAVGATVNAGLTRLSIILLDPQVDFFCSER